jgi:CheY-like chemotaxis protein
MNDAATRVLPMLGGRRRSSRGHPCCSTQEIVADVTAHERPYGRSGKPLLTGYHVLVVEDKDDSRDMLRQALEAEGASVTDAVSAEEALWILRGRTIDAVLTDVMLGGREHDGIWLLREMLTSPPLDRLCVIAVTGRKELERELLKLGFWAVLIKPVTPMDLGAFLLGCFERGR